jgi:hypothetical protein
MSEGARNRLKRRETKCNTVVGTGTPSVEVTGEVPIRDILVDRARLGACAPYGTMGTPLGGDTERRRSPLDSIR